MLVKVRVLANTKLSIMLLKSIMLKQLRKKQPAQAAAAPKQPQQPSNIVSCGSMRLMLKSASLLFIPTAAPHYA
jgi:hypothetical protein